MATYTDIFPTRRSFNEFQAVQIGAGIPINPYLEGWSHNNGTVFLGGNNKGIVSPIQEIANLQFFYIDNGQLNEITYVDTIGGFSGCFMTGYYDLSNFLVYGVVSLTDTVNFAVARMFEYDGSISYVDVACDFSIGQFDGTPYGSSAVNNDITNPAIGLIQEDSNNSKFCMQLIYKIGSISNTVNMFEYNANYFLYNNAATNLGGATNRFGYCGYFDDGVTYFEFVAIADTVDDIYSNPIVSTNYILKPDNSPIDVTQFSFAVTGQSDTQFFAVTTDGVDTYLFAFDFDGSQYDLYIARGIASYNATLNNGEFVIAELVVSNIFLVSLSQPSTGNKLKILTPIVLPCTNPCIPLLKGK